MATKKKVKRKTTGRKARPRKKSSRKKARGTTASTPSETAPRPRTQRLATSDAERPDERVTLEDFLVACQKSLARSTTAAEHASRAESEFAQGERHLYVIDGLDLDLSASLSMSFEADDEHPGKLKPHAVMLDFTSTDQERSRLKFRVETRPLDLLEGASLQLANLDPLGDLLPDAHLRTWLVDERGAEIPGHDVHLQFMPEGGRDPSMKKSLKLTTDMMGRVNFWLRPRRRDLVVEVVGDKVYRRRILADNVENYLLWVTCDLQPETGPPVTLSTEVLRLPTR